MTELLIFSATFFSVFFLGFQSLIVNSGHVVVAMMNSTLIGMAQLFLLKSIPHSNTWQEYLAYIIAGPFAVPCAIYVHKRWFRREKEEE